MTDNVTQIKDRLSVVEVLSSYIKLEKAGRNFKAKCPFHNEKTPSFMVSPERGSYYCFGCQEHGDIFTFVEKFEGVDFRGALKILADRAGVTLERFGGAGEKDVSARLFEIMEEATRFYENNLSKNPAAKEYCAKRSINDATTRRFRLGWVSDEWHALHQHLLAKKFSEEEMFKCGLIKRKENESGPTKHFYDVFRGRLMFPICDPSGRVIAFSGRLLAKETEHAPKYLNSPETPLFKKSETLYAFDLAKSSIRKYNFAILVEGPVDVLLSHQSGFTNAVAVLGTASTEHHARRLKNFSNNLVIALDADSAGFASAAKTARLALAAGMDVKLAALPEGTDPADAIAESVDTWKTAIRSASHVVDFLIAKLKREHGADERKFAQHIRSEVLPFVAAIPDKLDQSHFIKKCAEVMDVSEQAVREEVAKIVREIPRPGGLTATPARAALRRADRQEELFAILRWQAGAEEKLIDVDETLARAADALGQTKDELSRELSDALSRTDDAAAFRAEKVQEQFGTQDSVMLHRHIDEILLHIEREKLKKELRESRKEEVQKEHVALSHKLGALDMALKR